MDKSPTTGEEYYSGSWQSIQDILRVIDIGEGKMAKVNEPMVNVYQETVDRDIDAILGELYHVPLRAMNQMQPNGVTKRVFPGDVLLDNSSVEIGRNRSCVLCQRIKNSYACRHMFFSISAFILLIVLIPLYF